MANEIEIIKTDLAKRGVRFYNIFPTMENTFEVTFGHVSMFYVIIDGQIIDVWVD